MFVREIISPKTGEIINRSVFGISEDDYLNLRRSCSDNKFDLSLLKGRDGIICFTTFDACFQHASFSVGSPLDQTLCEWLPCKTVAYVTCTIAAQAGWIEESDCFKGCAACDIIIGLESNNLK